jgi:centromeric protein E
MPLPLLPAARPALPPALPADGVTSSGKTHTMIGTDEVPGIVPHAVAEVFRLIARTPGKEFLLRLSMMEIYNEVGGGWRVGG